MGAWILHRATGLAIFLFLVIHVLEAVLLKVSASAYDTLIKLYTHPLFTLAEVGLMAALLFHALNGLRIIAIDFSDFPTRQFHKVLYWLVWALFLGLFIPGAWLMIQHLVPTP
ncbi:succinate dehydrogenase, cytochrome b556 subunit [bacterium]|nr:succinate dehydrogenase, cytochrome b556 subunit [bacterium]